MAQRPFQTGAAINLSAGESVKDVVVCTVPARKRFEIKFLGINGFGHPNQPLFYAVQVIYNRNSRVIPLLLVAVVWYTIITTILSIAQYYIERYYARGSVRTLPPTPLQRFRRWTAVQWARLGEDGAKAPPREPVSAALPVRPDAAIDANEETR